MAKVEGISGLTKLFRESVASVPDGSMIVFVGSEAVCPPFAQLLAYAIRDRKMSMGFVPKAIWEKGRCMNWVDGAGFQIGNEPFDAAKANVVVILGGLAIPKFGCSVQEVNSLISRIPGITLVIGVGFMDVFRKAAWDKQVRFDALIDAYMSAENI